MGILFKSLNSFEFIKNRNHSDEILNAEGCGDANFENNEVRGIDSIKDFQENMLVED